MAVRDTLHIKHVGAFKAFLVEREYTLLPIHGYEVVKATNHAMTGPKRTLILYRRADASEHLTVQSHHHKLLREFMEQREASTFKVLSQEITWCGPLKERGCPWFHRAPGGLARCLWLDEKIFPSLKAGIPATCPMINRAFKVSIDPKAQVWPKREQS